MMDRTFVDLEVEAGRRRRVLLEEAAATRLLRSTAAPPTRRRHPLRSATAAALIALAGWLDERYAERAAPGVSLRAG